MNGIDALRELPTPVLVVIAAAASVQVVLVVWCLVRLAREKSSQIGGVSRWAWVVVILFGNLIGAVIFLFVHSRDVRSRAAVAAAEDARPGGKKRAVADVISGLYQERQQ